LVGISPKGKDVECGFHLCIYHLCIFIRKAPV
jgi:hypothetical protein